MQSTLASILYGCHTNVEHIHVFLKIKYLCFIKHVYLNSINKDDLIRVDYKNDKIFLLNIYYSYIKKIESKTLN